MTADKQVQSVEEKTHTDQPINISEEQWREISAGLCLSRDDLSMITAGLELLMKAQEQLATLAKEQHREDNLTQCLEDWSSKVHELLQRVLDHHATCLLKAAELQQ